MHIWQGRKTFTYTVEPHQGTADYEGVHVVFVQQNPVYAHARLQLVREGNIYTVEVHQGVITNVGASKATITWSV